jgi:hypothetical protein
MRSLAFTATLLLGTLSFGQKPFNKVELQSNVLAVGEVSSVRLSGGNQPYTLSFLLRGETKEVSIADAKGFLIGHVNEVRSSNEDVLIEFKPVKPFKGALVVRDATGREAKFDLFCGDEKLLRDFGKSPNP